MDENINLSVATIANYNNFEDFYTKEEIDQKGFLQEIPDYYVTQNELKYTIEEIDSRFYPKIIMDEILKNFYTKEEIQYRYESIIDLLQTNYVNKNELSNAISDIKYISTITDFDSSTYKLGTLIIKDNKYDILGIKTGGGGNGSGSEIGPGDGEQGDRVYSGGYYVQVYTISNSTPKSPVGGYYNFATKEFSDPDGWYSDITKLGKGKIWWSVNTFFPDLTNSGWSTPLELVTSETILESLAKYESYTVFVYCEFDGNASELYTPTGGKFNASTKSLDQYPKSTTESGKEVIWNTVPGESKGVVWVSYNNYTVVNDNEQESLTDENGTGWSTPVKYRNVQAELQQAAEEAQNYYQEQLDNANSELTQTINNAQNLLEEAEKNLETVKDLFESIDSGEIDAVGLQKQISELNAEIKTYGWVAEDPHIIVSDVLNNFPIPLAFKAKVGDKFAINKGTKLTYEGVNGQFQGVEFYVIPEENGLGNAQYHLVECEENGNIKRPTKPLCASVYDSDEYQFVLLGDYGTTEKDVVKFIGQYRRGFNYAEQLFSAMQGRYKILLSKSDPDSEAYKRSILDMTYNYILSEVSDVNVGTGTIKDAIQTITANQISNTVSQVTQEDLEKIQGDLDNAKEQLSTVTRKVEQSSLSMTPTEIMLSVLSGVSGAAIVSDTFYLPKTISQLQSMSTSPTPPLITFNRQYSASELVENLKFTDEEGRVIVDLIIPDNYELTKIGNIRLKSNNRNIGNWKYKDDQTIQFYFNNSDTTQLYQLKWTSAELTDVTSSLVSILRDKIKLSAASEKGGVSLTIDGEAQNVIIDAPEVKITGTMIANAIVSNGLRIWGNTSSGESIPAAWIKGGSNQEEIGESMFGTGSVLFRQNGSGYLAGGLIKWTKQNNDGNDPENFTLSVKGVVEAEGGVIGGWTIGDNKLFATSDKYGVVVSPEALYAGKTNNQPNASIQLPGWKLNPDGSGFVANNFIHWGADGTINGIPTVNARTTCHITMQNYQAFLLRVPNDLIKNVHYNDNNNNLHGIQEARDAAIFTTVADYIPEKTNDVLLKPDTHVYILDLQACSTSILIDNDVLYYITGSDYSNKHTPTGHGATIICIPSCDRQYLRLDRTDVNYDSKWYDMCIQPYTSEGTLMSESDYMNCLNKTYTIRIVDNIHESNPSIPTLAPVKDLYLLAFNDESNYYPAVLDMHRTSSYNDDVYQTLQWVEEKQLEPDDYGTPTMIEYDQKLLPEVGDMDGCISQTLADSAKRNVSEIQQSPYLYRPVIDPGNEYNGYSPIMVELTSPNSETVLEPDSEATYEVTFYMHEASIIEPWYEYEGPSYNKTGRWRVRQLPLFKLASTMILGSNMMLNPSSPKIDPWNQGKLEK